MDLRRLLLNADSSGRETLERLLRHDCCLPRATGARRVADEIRARVGSHRSLPGETPLVAVTGSQASLWLLEPRPGRVEFIGSAKAALKLAEQRITRDLPLLFEANALPDVWSARRLVTESEQSLDGSSFGLSFCLAVASLMLAIPLPTDLLASAAVTPDGDLEAVDESALARKLRLVHDWAPGIRSFVVAAENAEFARRVTAEFGAGFDVVGAASLQNVLEVAFPRLIEALEARFDDSRRRQHAARRLFELVRDGSSTLLSWRGVAASCRWLAERLPESDARLEAEFAEAVARRHAGEELPCPLRFSWVEAMPRPLRLRVIAHLIEHSRFHEASERRQILEFAERDLASRALDDGPEDLKALGALGRSYAAFREFGAAKQSLARALDGFRALGLLEQSSFALSEWIRILGIESRLDRIRQLAGPAAEPPPAAGAVEHRLAGFAADFLALPGASPLSRAFVRFALGRAFVQAGAPAEALPFLGDSVDPHWSLTPAHLQASRLRWLGRALVLCGEKQEAGRVFAALSDLADRCTEAAFARALADIDAELEANRDPSEPLAALRRLEPEAVRQIETGTCRADTWDLARAVVIHYPY